MRSTLAGALESAGTISIKAILNGVIGAVALLLVVVSGWSLWTGWNSYQLASHIEQVSGVDKLIFQTMQALRNERSGLNRALMGTEPDDSAVREEVDKTVDAAKSVLTAALEAIAEADLPQSERLLGDLQTDAAEAERLRQTALAEFRKPGADRNDDVRKTYYDYAAVSSRD
jgi:hypothetical protein